MERAAAIWRVTRGPFLESPLSGPLDLVRQTWRLNDLRTIAPWSTLRGLGRGYFSDPRLVTLLDRYATYTGSDPRRAPAALAVVPYVEQTFGAWHVGGGLRRLGDALSERCDERGIAFRFGADVAEVLVEGGRAAGVRLVDGELRRRRRRGRQRRRHATSTATCVADPRRDAAAREPAQGDPLPVRLRAAAGGARPHARAAAPQRLVPRGDYDDEFDAIFGRPAAARWTTRPSTSARPTTR